MSSDVSTRIPLSGWKSSLWATQSEFPDAATPPDTFGFEPGYLVFLCFLKTFNFCCCCCSVLCDPYGLQYTRRHPLSFTVSQSLLKFMPIESMMPSNHLILCHPLLLLPSVLPSIRVSYWPRLTACGILVPWPGMEPMPFAVEACWTTREAPRMSSFCFQTFMIINSSIICLSLTHSIRSIAYQLVCMEGFISPNALNNCWAWLNNVTALCVSGMNVCESVFSLITIFVRSVVFVCSCYFV